MNREKTEERRRQVWQMLLRGIPETVIAKMFDVHRNTIVTDVRVLRMKNRQLIKDADVLEEIGDAAARFEEMFQNAMSEFATTKETGTKLAALDRAMSAMREKVRLLVETGILPRAAQEIAGTLKVEGVDVKNASLEELKAMRLRLLSELSDSPEKKEETSRV